MLIDESKEPQGYFVAVACLDAVGHDIAVGDVGNLGEAFFLGAWWSYPRPWDL